MCHKRMTRDEKRLREKYAAYESQWAKLKSTYDTELANRWMESRRQLGTYLNNDTVSPADKVSVLERISNQLTIIIDAQKFGQDVSISNTRFLIAYIESLTDMTVTRLTLKFREVYEAMMNNECPSLSSPQQISEIFALLQRLRQKASASSFSEEKIISILDIIFRALRHDDNYASVVNTITNAISNLNEYDLDAPEVYATQIKNVDDLLDKKDNILSNLNAHIARLENSLRSIEQEKQELIVRRGRALEIGKKDIADICAIRYKEATDKANNLSRHTNIIRENKNKFLNLIRVIEELRISGISFRAFEVYFKNSSIVQLLAPENYGRIMNLLHDLIEKNKARAIRTDFEKENTSPVNNVDDEIAKAMDAMYENYQKFNSGDDVQSESPVHTSVKN